MVNFLIFGPPGSGKGTQSVMLSGKFNLLHLSTGDMLRAEIAAGTDLGKKMSLIMSKGELVPDEVVIEMIAHKILFIYYRSKRKFLQILLHAGTNIVPFSLRSRLFGKSR